MNSYVVMRPNLFLLMFLLVVAVLCALSVITSRHQARKLYMELQKQVQRSKQLDIDWGRLQLEQSTWAAHTRIEAQASRRIGMHVPNASQTHVIPQDIPIRFQDTGKASAPLIRGAPLV